MGVGTRRATLGALMGAVITLGATTARADVVTEWNEQVFTIGGPQIQRTLALVHIAMFDAANAIEPRYTSYMRLPQAPGGASRDAAAAAAARGVLVLLFPEQRAALDEALAASIRTIPAGLAKTSGLQYGDLVAQFVYGRRLTDRLLTPGPPYIPGTGPGAYQLTGPAPVNTGAPSWLPFALKSADQFRPAGPAALTSAQYARDLDETRLLGGTVSGARTRDQEEIARFHSEQAQFQFNRIARAESAADGEGVLKHARLFALLNMALADAITAVFEAKYFYNS
jgi:hypothetical protein